MEVNDFEVDKDLLYTDNHEWVKVNGDEVLIGINDYAQSELGDIVFVELPKEGNEFNADDVLCEVESVKAVSEVYSPVTGVVSDVNDDLLDAPEEMNDNPFDAWIAKVEIEDESELDELMEAEEYSEFLKEE